MLAPRLAVSLAALLACAPAPGETTDGTSSDGGDETFGMGVTSASPSGQPPDPTSAGTISTSTTTTTTTPTTTSEPPDPSLPPTLSTEPDPTTTPPDPSTTAPGPCADPPGQPHSAPCTDESGCGCASGRCFVVPLVGGFCSDCLVDADCPGGGCTVPDPLHGVGARCNKGEPGAGCMSDDVCTFPGAGECAPVFDVPGVFTVATCGQCSGDGDCPPDAPHCVPDYDLSQFSGTHVCAPPGARADGQGCEPDLGDAACASGRCGEADVMGLLVLGVCGECEVDGDCAGDQTCTPALVDLGAEQILGATCD
jgi:hypothetical protein